MVRALLGKNVELLPASRSTRTDCCETDYILLRGFISRLTVQTVKGGWLLLENSFLLSRRRCFFSLTATRSRFYRVGAFLAKSTTLLNPSFLPAFVVWNTAAQLL